MKVNLNMKRIKIRFEKGEVFTATLLEGQAPKTCEYVWDSLPFDSSVKQSRWSGREVNLSYVQYDLPPIRENQTIYTNEGEICYWREWNWEGDTSPPQAIAIYYGAELARSHKGNEPVNVFAKVDQEQTEALKSVCERVWLNGAERIHFEQLIE